MNPAVRDLKKELMEKFEEIFSETEEPEPPPEPIKATKAHMDALAAFHRLWEPEKTWVHLNTEDTPVLHSFFKPRKTPHEAKVADDEDNIRVYDAGEKSSSVEFLRIGDGALELDLGENGKIMISGAFISL